MRSRLASECIRLDDLLAAYGAPADGGTSLFRHVTTSRAAGLFASLGAAGILARNFDGRPNELRFGLPGDEAGWRRLETVLANWHGNNRGGGARAVALR
jgi:cobalamin biosynthetic protein CobC